MLVRRVGKQLLLTAHKDVHADTWSGLIWQPALQGLPMWQVKTGILFWYPLKSRADCSRTKVLRAGKLFKKNVLK